MLTSQTCEPNAIKLDEKRSCRLSRTIPASRSSCSGDVIQEFSARSAHLVVLTHSFEARSLAILVSPSMMATRQAVRGCAAAHAQQHRQG